MSNLIQDPTALLPSTPWHTTQWGHTTEESLITHTSKARLCPAVLLPFKDSLPDWAGFAAALHWMARAGQHYGVEIVYVLNADTGYIFHLDAALYAEVLQRFRAELPHARCIIGVTTRGADAGRPFRAEHYLPLLDIAQQHSNCEIMLMTSQALNALEPTARRDAYYALAEHLTHPAIVHALEPAFVPWATPFEPWLLWQLALHPKFIGGKISTLDEPHFLYWAAMCRDLQLDFLPHSGDDFGLATAIKLGLPLLIGAASSAAPLICAAQDMWLADTDHATFDPRVYKLLEAIQSYQDQVFRLDASGSAAAYKHSTAHALVELGILTSSEPHPQCPDRRGPDESARMREALHRPRRIATRLSIPGFI